MCGIAGILSKSGKNVVPSLGMMLQCMVNRGPDGAGLFADGQIVKYDSIRSIHALTQVSGSSAIGHTRLAIVGGTCGAQPFASCDGRFILEHNGEIYNYKSLRKKIVERHKLATKTDSEVIVHLLEENANGDSFVGAIRKTVAALDGVYALAIKDEQTGQVALVRDRIGVRQLYYGENSDCLAFASERKALWRIGIIEPTSRLLPGSALIIHPEGKLERFQVASPIPYSTRNRYDTMDSAVTAYKNALIDSVRKRTQDLQKIGVIFSGGIDSVLVAKLASQIVPEVTCYTGGVKGSNDITCSRQIAKRIGLDLKVCEFTEQDVDELIPKIIEVIEDSNAGQVEVALPIYGAVALAQRDGIKVMITGQGADELFGGYSWYSKIAEKQGYNSLREHMIGDLLLLYKETLEREDKITMAHSIELREPFLDTEVIKVALETDMHLNISEGLDPFGKRVHRRLAEILGIPREIAYRVKEAAQHGSGIHECISSISRKHGYDENSVPASYMQVLKDRERIGSSQRYGYLFTDDKIWATEPQVQMYLDNISNKMPKPEILAKAKNSR